MVASGDTNVCSHATRAAAASVGCIARRAGNIDEAVDGLYALPLADFTSERNALAKHLRAEGERGAAEEVARLEKPSVAAWAINRVARERPDDVKRLVAAGRELGQAQRDLMAGGDRDRLDVATSEQRKIVAKLGAAAARMLAEERGRPSAPAVRERIEETLRATASDEEARELVLVGRLTRERSVVALNPFDVATSGPQRTRGGRKKDAGGAAGRRRTASVEKRLAREQEREREARARKEEADREMRDAQEDARDAATRLKRAEAAQGRAESRLRESAERLRTLREELSREARV